MLRYLEEVLEENRRLRNTLSESGVSHPEPTADPNAPIANNGANPTTEDDDAVQNPLLESRPWFLPVASLDMPIHIGEAADAAFATRVRQTIANEASIHFPRMSYVSDEIILQTSEQDCPWPTPARARFLVRVALDTICRCYHMVLRSEVFEMLEQSIQDFTSCDRPTICKLYVLFALGEVYSTKTAAAENSFPGLAYFSCSRRMVNVPAERSGIVNLEICLLLVGYTPDAKFDIILIEVLVSLLICVEQKALCIRTRQLSSASGDHPWSTLECTWISITRSEAA